jgi:adenylate cyclase
VVRRAVEENESLSGDERDVAVLFIDLVGSVQLASTRDPHEVAEVLNDFFRIVVAEVDKHRGLINKFQGDAALAVFGAPLRTDDPASAALATARALGTELRRLPVDFGIGVSAGPVFAGNIGAENRYEYTVVGDAVNEAARLADRAKECDGRVLCSGAVIDCADETERGRWAGYGSEVLRGRAEATEISAPVT